MTEPVSLALAKQHMRVDPSFTDDDVYLAGLITAARAVCEAEINRPVAGVSRTLVLDGFPSAADPALTDEERALAVHIALPGGTVSAASVAWIDSAGANQTLDPSAYKLDSSTVPARLAPVVDWPDASGFASVTITYTVSVLTPDETAIIVQAILLLIEGWYSHRSGIGVDVRGVPTEVPLSVSFILAKLASFGGR